MRIALGLLAILVAVVAVTSDDAGPGKKVLVVLEDSTIKGTHSIFFKSLTDSGYTLDFRTTNEKAALKKYGEWNYDNLILFSPSSATFAGITSLDVIEFVDAGHNVIVAGSGSIGSAVSTIASECNVEFDQEDTYVIDHFNFDVSDFDGKHTRLVADNILENAVIFPTKVNAPVLFEGVGQDIQEDSALVFSVLSAAQTAYSHDPDSPVEALHVAGKKTSLVSAMQARNNARVIFSGSLSLFSDKFFKSSVQKYSQDGKAKTFDKSGNEVFVKQLVQWAFHERGILRTRDVSHHKKGEKEAPFTYTIKEDLEYSITIEEWNGQKWVPFVANDVQLEFIMLDPYIRTTMEQDGKGHYHTAFTIPDVYGVFTFKVEYVRKGYGFTTSITRSPVRPFRHNEYERFIDAAFPYYASAFSMMGGLFLFSWVFLYHRDSPKQ